MEFTQFLEDLSTFGTIQFPRAIVKNSLKQIQLQMFADASEQAYAGVIYACALDILENETVK